jgi:hypothetical protein
MSEKGGRRRAQNAKAAQGTRPQNGYIPSTYHVHLLFFRYSGPVLYPLDKSVGYETSGISCPGSYTHNHEAVRLEVARLVPPLAVVRLNYGCFAVATAQHG